MVGSPQQGEAQECHGDELVCPVHGDLLFPFCQKGAFSLRAVLEDAGVGWNLQGSW